MIDLDVSLSRAAGQVPNIWIRYRAFQASLYQGKPEPVDKQSKLVTTIRKITSITQVLASSRFLNCGKDAKDWEDTKVKGTRKEGRTRHYKSIRMFKGVKQSVT